MQGETLEVLTTYHRNMRWSRHAEERAAEMKVPKREVQLAVLDAEFTYRNGREHPAGTTHVRGRIAVPVSTDDVILTVLWNREEGR